MNAVRITPSLEEFRQLARTGNLIPVWTELIADAESPVSAFQKIDDGGYSFLFESVEKSEQAGRYSFVGGHPRVLFESRGRRVRITENGSVREFETATDPLRELEVWMARYRPVQPAFSAEAFLFPTKTGRPMSVSNYERLLRSFVDDNREALARLGVEVDEYTTHLYRRTTATLVERAAGLTLASRLLGHANEQITRTSYVVTAEQVDPVTVDILDSILGA